MTSRKQKQLAQQTDRDLRAIRDQVEKRVLRIGARFGDIDNCMVTSADDLLREVNRWIEGQPAYMDECVQGGNWNF
jgi:hypothetical protein